MNRTTSTAAVPAAADYRYLLPGIEPHGRGGGMTLIDPASKRLHFFERATT